MSSNQSERPERIEFWMVWHEDGGQPRYKHHSKKSALDEATRLAKLTPGECFYVLKATAGVIAREPDIARVKITVDPIPF